MNFNSTQFLKKNLKNICLQTISCLKNCNFAVVFTQSNRKVMLEHLKPISKNHSISKAVATIYLAQPVLRPELVLNKLTSKADFSDYQKKSLGRLKKVQFDVQKNTIQEDDNDISGFLLESFNEAGKVKDIFRLQNGQDNNPTILALETRSYIVWDDFYKKIEKDFSSFADEYSFFINGISLTYIDDFNWISDLPIPIKEIFKTDSEFLNQQFLLSKNGSITLFTQNDDESEEKTEIAFSNKVKKVIINHQFARKINTLGFQEFHASEDFKKYFQEAHDANKEILRNLLTDEVQDLIKLNQKNNQQK